MIASVTPSSPLRSLASSLFLSAALMFCLPAVAADHHSDKNDDRNTINSNVPLNEINIRAYRHFQKRFPLVTDEYWLKTQEGYIVSYTKANRRNQVHYDLHGAFLYSVSFHAGEDIPMDAKKMIERRYPGCQIGVVAEISNGEKSFYMAKIDDGSSIKTLSISDGEISVVDNLKTKG